MTGPTPIRVLVVDDEPIALAAHADYVRRLDGFEVVAEAHGMGAALAVLNDPATPPIQLILLDMNLTDGHGLDLLRRIHGLGLVPDVVAITAVRDIVVVRSAIALGITAYLIKPFTLPDQAIHLCRISGKAGKLPQLPRRVGRQVAHLPGRH